MVRSAPHRHQKNSKRLKWKRIVHITLLTLVFTWMIYQFNHKRSQTAGEEERHLRRKSLNDVRVDLFGRKALKPELGATSTVPGGDGIDGALDGDGNTMEKPLYADEDFGKEETINNDMDVLERGVEEGDEEGDEERDEERDGEEKMDTEKLTTSLVIFVQLKELEEGDGRAVSDNVMMPAGEGSANDTGDLNNAKQRHEGSGSSYVVDQPLQTMYAFENKTLGLGTIKNRGDQLMKGGPVVGLLDVDKTLEISVEDKRVSFVEALSKDHLLNRVVEDSSGADTASLTGLETVNSEKGLQRQDEEKWDEASQQNLGSVKMDGGADMHVKDSTSQGTDNNPSITQSTENAELDDNLEEADDSDMDDTDDEVF